jgi:hypothetical protein
MFCSVPDYETNGRLWHDAVRWLLFGLFLLQVTVAGYLATNGIYFGALTMLPLLGITWWFQYYCKKVWKSQCIHVPMDTLINHHPKDNNESRKPKNHGPLLRLVTLDRIGVSQYGKMNSCPSLHPTSEADGSHLGRSVTSPVESHPKPDDTFSSNSVECMSSTSSFQEVPDPNPQTYFPPSLWSPLPTSMWLPKDPAHSGRFDLENCVNVDGYCVSNKLYGVYEPSSLTMRLQDPEHPIPKLEI